MENLTCKKSIKLAREHEREILHYFQSPIDEKPCCFPLTVSASTLLLVSHVVTVCGSENSTKAVANYFIWCFWFVVFGMLENGF